MRSRKILSVSLLVLVLIVTAILPGMAASTPKNLSTNFTLVNLGDTAASGVIQYLKEDGSQWKPNENFSISTPGGQAIYRQYFDGALSAGRGSVVVSADQAVGAVVQIMARDGQVPSNDAYVGMSQGSTTQYIPVVLRRKNTASGLGNSQIIVQNASANTLNASVKIVKPDGTTQYTKPVNNLAAGQSFTYDLDDESATNIPNDFYGSAVVSTVAPGSIVAVSNEFLGANTLMTFNGFSAPGRSWLVPLFTSHLSNNLGSVVTVQNLSGGPIAIGGVTVTCTRNPASPAPASFSRSNLAAIANSASWDVNAITDATLPTGWYGSCSVTSSADVVSFVQLRYSPGDMAAAYQAIRGDSTDKTVIVPLAAKQLSNFFATVTNVVNVSSTAPANVTFTYIPSPEYVLAGGSSTPITIGPVTIPAGGQMQHNLRGGAITQLPTGWYGSTKIVSSDQPINAVVELTYTVGSGDTYQAHNVFTKP